MISAGKGYMFLIVDNFHLPNQEKQMNIRNFAIKFLAISALILSGCGAGGSPDGDPVTGSPDIRYNQTGYYPAAPKEFAVVNSEETGFEILDNTDDSVVHTGTLSDNQYWSDSGENVKQGDFTSFQTPGTWKIRVGEMVTGPFIIGDNILEPVTRDLLKFFYFQRASMAITAANGGVYARSAGHADTAADYHSTTGKSGSRNVPGGWYDAGDYGKYIVNGGISIATLMGLYEAAGDVAGDSALNIPESGNGRSDLLDEMKYELDWFKTMQDTDGGVFFKVAAITWANAWCMPSEDPNTRYVIGKSTSAALNFAAVMAQASRVFAAYDAAWAADCETRAINAWNWAVDNPSMAGPQDSQDSANGGSGAYGDGDYSDEFIWAACELWLATGDAEYSDYIDSNMGGYTLSGPAYWGGMKNLGLFSLAIAGSGTRQTSARNAITGFADTILDRIEEHPYAIPMQTSDFGWGSNGGLGNYGVILAYAWIISGDTAYLQGTARLANYLLGKNATGYGFITGYGHQKIMYPHHRPSATDGIADPVPGMVAGGPNPGQNDAGANVSYPSDLPATSFVDDTDSYASNEVTINWNAPAYFMFAVMEKDKSSF
jgi:endoglucanase